MSKTNKKLIALAVSLGSLTSISASAQTIDSLIMTQRAKMVEENNKKNNPLAVISGQGSAPIQLQAQPTLPTLSLPDFPGHSADAPKPVEKPVMKAVFDISNTKFVAVYGINGNLIAEITYNGYLARVVKDAELIDGWFVQSIDDKKVILTKKVPKKGQQTHALLFNIGDAVIKTVAIPPKKPIKKKPAPSAAPASTIEQLGIAGSSAVAKELVPAPMVPVPNIALSSPQMVKPAGAK